MLDILCSGCRNRESIKNKYVPCSDNVQWSYCSRCQSLYWHHSGRVHMSGSPTNHEGTAALSYEHKQILTDFKVKPIEGSR